MTLFSKWLGSASRLSLPEIPLSAYTVVHGVSFAKAMRFCAVVGKSGVELHAGLVPPASGVKCDLELAAYWNGDKYSVNTRREYLPALAAVWRSKIPQGLGPNERQERASAALLNMGFHASAEVTIPAFGAVIALLAEERGVVVTAEAAGIGVAVEKRGEDYAFNIGLNYPGTLQ
jgi:hypothetical protein